MPHTPHAPKTRRLAAVLAGAALALAAVPALALEAFSADYRASYMGMKANGTMTLKPEGNNRWRYTLDVSNALASLSQSTVFQVEGGQWRPLTSKDSSKVLVKSSDKTASYDWDAGVARWTGDVKPDRAGPIKLKAGDMDALLINLALVRDFEAGKPLKYRMVDDGRVKQMHYREAGTDQVTVGGQAREATRLVHDEGDKQTVVWLVEGMPVPARIQHRKDGDDSIDLTVVSVN